MSVAVMRFLSRAGSFACAVACARLYLGIAKEVTYSIYNLLGHSQEAVLRVFIRAWVSAKEVIFYRI